LSQPEIPGPEQESPEADISVVAKAVDGDGLANRGCACLTGGEERPYMEIKCKGKLPLSVFLVINDNPYGLMFSLSFS
jgi:hypothetical protein